MSTVAEQGLCAAADPTVIEVCRVEGRVLVSLDKGFTNTLVYPPQRYTGIVVLRLPEPLRNDAIEGALRRVASAAAGSPLAGRLWIVDARRIREFRADDDET